MGKARIFTDDAREAVYQSEFDNEVYTTASQQNSYNLGSVHFSDQSGIGNFQQSGRDQRNAALDGALFRGNIGFIQETVLLDVGTDTIDLNNDDSAVVLPVIPSDRIVSLSAGTTADLVTITGAQRPGQRLTLYNILGNIITIKNTAGAVVDTILTPGNTDYTLQNNEAVTLAFSLDQEKWIIVGPPAGSGGTGYDTIQDEGIALAQQTTFNFIGAGVTAVDNAGLNRTDITIPGGASSQTPWLSDIDAASFDLNNLGTLSFDVVGTDIIVDTIGMLNTVPTGDVFDWTIAGASKFVIATSLISAKTDLSMGTFNIIGGGAGEGMTNVGHFDFVDNLATPISALSIYNDGTFLQANTNSLSGNLFITPAAQDLNMIGNAILDVLYMESAVAVLPGSGFIRMGTAEEIRMRNPGNTDDLIITSGNDALANQAIIFQVASGNQMTISASDIDVKDNDIINTADIQVGSGAHDIGEEGNPYTNIFANRFRPISIGATNADGYQRVGTDRHLISFDSGSADSGFGIYRDGVQRFLFSVTGSTPFVHELFIGPDPFLSGETYRIQMGENSNSSAKIELTEGGNDLIIDRQGAATTRSVLLRTGGVTRFSTNSTESEFFSDVNISSEDITNVGNVFADVSATSTFGEFQPSNGGFDYILRSRMSWESDPLTYIEMDAGGLDVVSDDAITISAVGAGSIYSALTNHNFFANSINVLTLQDNAVVSLVDIFVGTNFENFTEITIPINPSANEGRMYAKDVGGITTPMWLDSAGTESSMIAAGGGGGNSISQGDSSVTVTDTGTDGLVTTVIDGVTLGLWDDVNGLEVRTPGILITSPANIRFGSTTRNIADDTIDNGMAITSPGGEQFNLKWGAALEYDFNETEFDLHSNNINSVGPILEFQSSGGAILWPIGTNPNRTQITASTSNMRFKVGSAGDEFVFTQVTTDLMEINSAEMRLINSDLEMDLTQDIRWSGSVGGTPRIGTTISSILEYEMPASGTHEFINGTLSSVFINEGEIKMVHNLTAGGIFEFFRSDSTPSDFDLLGTVKFTGNVTGPAELTYADIIGDIIDNNPTDAKGALRFRVVSGGASLRTGIEISGQNDTSDGVEIGAYGVQPVLRQPVTGSRGGNAALASLITALENQGWVIDNTSA